MPKIKMDEEMKAFAADVAESIAQARRGEAARVHTPADIATYKARGRPVGSTEEETKQAVTVRYSPDVLAAFRATGAGWQARMNDALKDWLQTHSPV
ncbi:MAG: BrnA antitoxin family protein [Hydrogenophaga sp.]|uniref:BrnA antitoxin family protein n=1 Tax=Hydrogenophaga sp. TaxID=1904254 RepID=UPI002732070F|nr:BrnA antitoxin family protein [Hydrogenophaga sp.]MDP2163218.1 BrnA antitoxin family protein [Hydrogenophaga sp.]MDP3476315.1 BrnA antitoxin family protein [Hydrogenophaga sp.]